MKLQNLKKGQKFENKFGVEVEIIDIDLMGQTLFRRDNEFKCYMESDVKRMLELNGYIEK